MTRLNIRLPDPATTVLVRTSIKEFPVWPGFYDGERWRFADGTELDGPVLGWMEIEEAARVLDEGPAKWNN